MEFTKRMYIMKFVRYEKTVGDGTEFIEGLEDKRRFIFRLIDFNEFEKESVKVPDGFRKVKVESWWVLEYKYDPDILIFINNCAFSG